MIHPRVLRPGRGRQLLLRVEDGGDGRQSLGRRGRCAERRRAGYGRQLCQSITGPMVMQQAQRLQAMMLVLGRLHGRRR